MAYTVIIEKKLEKVFDSLLSHFSDDIKSRLMTFLAVTPNLGKKEMQFRKYDLPNGNRVLYQMVPIKEGKVVAETKIRVVFAGDHNDYMRFLKKFSRKR